ncbi:MAG: VanW family protein [Chloroflexota bacterium]
MATYPVQRPARTDLAPVLLQAAAAAAGGLGIFLVFFLALVIGLNARYAGKVFPGVTLAGVSLSGLNQAQAQARILEEVTFPQTGQIVLEDGGQVWAVRPRDLGVSVDAAASAAAAFDWGRTGGPFRRLSEQLRSLHSGVSVSPQLVYDEQAAQSYLASLAALVDRPVVEASLDLQGAQVVAVPGQVGRTVDQPATLAALRAQVSRLMDGIVPLVVTETQPEIMDASAQAETARRYLSAPLNLSLPGAQPVDPGPWTVPPEQLANMLVVRRAQGQSGAEYQVALDEQALYTYLTAVAGDVNRSPRNARFIFNDETGLLERIQPAADGRTLDVYSSIGAINKSLAEGQHAAALTVVTTPPEVGNDASGQQLGVTELVMSYTSYFRGSSEERLQNVEKAAANFHGLLVPPGATFSMAENMENVSLDNGYAEAWIIYGGKTIKGVGGGVCQVSTTLFRTAFFAGFPIVERYSHAYRVGYYEQTAGGYDESMAGLDATVFLPLVDFKFVNDTPYWLLMETYYYPNSRSLTWKFYSTKDGRTVEWETSGLQNVIDAPDPTYEENAELPPGKIVQVDWAADGADVTVLRTVYKAGAAMFTDSFVTHYLPWADVFQYGPGTELPNQNKKKPGQFINPFMLLPPIWP